ncbi:MAG: phosphoribosyltransferase [Nanoarchaeota archaeon]|nr:phosphoribosyltransferase [Nanoarchaeota archaeon]
MGLELILAQKLEPEGPHFPISNPQLTRDASEAKGNIFAAFEQGDSYDRVLRVEAALLDKWKWGERWEDYLDSPLLAHADAALSLRGMYDAVVGVEKGGIPFSDIFEMLGFPVAKIEYSHYKRKMERPSMAESELDKLKKKKSILVVDVDVVTGQTIRAVKDYLLQHNINLNAAYTGLSAWPGIETEEPFIGEDKVNFKAFWKQCGSLRQLKSQYPYKKEIIPAGLRVFTSNGRIVSNEEKAIRAARRIGEYYK